MPERGRRRHEPQGYELLYGRNAVAEALAAGRRRFRRLLVADGAERQARVAALLALADGYRLPVERVRARGIEQLAPEVNHQGVLLEASPFPVTALADLLASAADRPILALDHIQDVQNLGSLIRTAEAAGAAGLIIPDRRAATVTPAVVNASAGAVEHLPVAATGNLARGLEECKEAGYWTVALDAEPPARLLYETDIPAPTVLIIGSEGKGIGPALLAHADMSVRLPMRGRVESLNAAVAGSIALYELVRRQGLGSRAD